MKKIVNHTLEQNFVLKKHSRYLCTISGGQDSTLNFLFLIHALELLKNSTKYKKFICWKKKGTIRNLTSRLELFYCQHFWQTKNFISSRFLFVLSYLFEIPFNISLPQDIVVTENSSRNWRKKNFCRIAQLQKSDLVLTGHTATDNIERTLYVLIRGTSTKGFVSKPFANIHKPARFFFPISALNSPLAPVFSLFELNQVAEFQKFFNQNKTHQNEASKDFSPKPKLNKYRKNQQKFYFSHSKQKINKSTFFCPQASVKKESKKNSNVQFRNQKMDLFYIKKIDSFSFSFYSKSLKTDFYFFKPLGNLSRFTITELIKSYQVPLINDLTNLSSSFSRNQIRHKLLPLIRYLFHKKFDVLVNTFQQTLLEQNQTMEKSTFEFLKSLKIFQDCFTFFPFSIHQTLTKDFLSKKISFTNSNTTIRKKLSVVNIFIEKNPALQDTLIQKVFQEYRDLELTFIQTQKLKQTLSRHSSTG